MNILLIGSGGREHALAWGLAKSPKLTKLYCAPGNGGICQIAECVDLNSPDHQHVIDFCTSHKIDLIVIGPEAPLVAGLSDDLRAKGFKVFGPSKAAAQLEGSKGFTKDLCAEYNIPTAAYKRFTDAASAKLYAQDQTLPIVIKADGLAAGKGVIIAKTHEEADAAIDDCFEGFFGEAGSEVVIEEFLDGEEASFFALTDGVNAIPLVTAQDHKRAFDGDEGPNTGGMGAYSPAPVMTPELCQRTMDEIILPTVKAMQARGIPYQGVLYAGLMITDDGSGKGKRPELIEYNARFGDPECQVLVMRLKSDLLEVLYAAASGDLSKTELDWHQDVALTVVMAANGYPGQYKKGTVIEGLHEAAQEADTQIFHAGTQAKDGQILANGGRVLNITARGKSVKDAADKAYRAIAKINWPGGFYRSDIGWRAIAREEGNNPSS